jgi:hypothetical protein
VNRSESLKEIAPALVKAQTDIKAALKDSTNPHFRSKYADLSSVVEAVKSPLLKNGISFLQGIHDAEGGVAVETMLLHTSGEWISSTLRIPASKQDAQGFGSAITYGRRYGLMAICGVPAEDDDGNAATAATAKQPAADPAVMKHLTEAAGKGVEAFREAWKGLTKDQRESVPQKALADLKAKCEEAVPA